MKVNNPDVLYFKRYSMKILNFAGHSVVHVHTAECCTRGAPPLHVPPNPRASPTGADSRECDFHCCTLHEEEVLSKSSKLLVPEQVFKYQVFSKSSKFLVLEQIIRKGEVHKKSNMS